MDAALETFKHLFAKQQPTPTVDAALEAVKNLSATIDEAGRRKLITSLHELAYSLEDANDTVHRLGYLHLQTAAAKIGFDTKLFHHLVDAGTPVSVEAISGKTGGDVRFFSRFMSYLASIGFVKQVGRDLFEANNVTRNLAAKVTEAGVSHCFVTIGPQYQALPSYLKKTCYANPSDSKATVLQDAWQTSETAFSWFTSHPEALGFFNDYMAFRRDAALSWLSVYPVQQETAGWDGERPVYVNIGGGVGHQCAQFRRSYPEIPGRVILQDLPHSIANAMGTAGVENMAHDFFDPQPIQGAKFYFTRGVLHNHPDERVKILLSRTKAVMALDSVMLLDEMVLPEEHVNSYATAMDLTMMCAMASMERSEEQWRGILEDVGLRLVKTYHYNPVSYEAVMDVRLP